MRKKLALFIGMTGLVLSVGCGQSEDNLLQKMLDANANTTFQQQGRTIAYRADTYDVDNKIHSAYAYVDPDRSVYECEEYMEVNENGDVYGIDNSDGTIYRDLFVDDSAKYRVIEITGYIENPDEVFVDKKKQDGKLIVHTRDENEESVDALAGNMEYYGYEVPETITVTNEYILDPKTYEIEKYNVYINTGNKDILFIENSRVDDPDVYEVDPKLTDAINAQDKRVVTVIADPGTDDETVYEQTIAKGCSVKIYSSEEHPGLYTDEACTQQFTGGIDRNEDFTVYTVHK